MEGDVELDSDCMFSCRIVDINSTLVQPIRGLDVIYSDFSGHPVKRIPVIRIFGSTPQGQKCCLHVHGAFPYLYIPCADDNPTDRYLAQLGQSIDHALAISLGSTTEQQHVFKISVVTGIPFYGYHSRERLFAKIYLYNPANVKRLCDLLLSGAVMNTSFQPHEAHIPFPLQFMIDYNLYGMNFIHTSAVKFRLGGDWMDNHNTPPPPPSPSVSVISTSSHSSILLQRSQRVWIMESLPDDMLISEGKVSTCELEADVLAADIMNREEIDQSSGGFPGLLAIWEEEVGRRESLGLDTPLSPPTSPDRICNLIHSAERRHKLELEEIIENRSSSNVAADVRMTPPILQTSFSFPLSQSCDVEVHQLKATPIKHDKSVDDSDVIVNEDMVQKKSEICQKLSTATLETSDSELLELLAELAGQSSSYPLSSSHPSGDGRELSRATPCRHSLSPLGSDIDLFEDTMVKRKGGVVKGLLHKGRSPSFDGYHDDTIPCNQYAEGGVNDDSRVVNVSSNFAMDTSWLDRSSRSRTPVILEDPSQGPSSQFPMRQLSFKEKRELIRICSDLSNPEEGDTEPCIVEDDTEEEEDESVFMSQRVVWEDDEQPLESDNEYKDCIPQLDGTGRKNQSTRLSLKSKPKRKNKTPEPISPTKSPDPTPPIGYQSTSTALKRETTPTFLDEKSDRELDSRFKRALSGSFVPIIVKLPRQIIEGCGSSISTSPVVADAVGPIDSSSLSSLIESTPFNRKRRANRIKSSERKRGRLGRHSRTRSQLNAVNIPSSPDHELCDIDISSTSAHQQLHHMKEDEVYHYDNMEVAKDERKTQVPMDEVMSSNDSKESLSQFESTVLDPDEVTEDESDTRESFKPRPDIVEVDNDFELVYSASETEGSTSESEVGMSQGSVSSELKVQEAIHWSATPPGSVVVTPANPPPTVAELIETASALHNIPSTRHVKPHFSNPKDVQQPRDFGGTLFWIPSTMSYDLKEFSPPLLPDSVMTSSNYFHMNHWRTVLAMSCQPVGHTQDTGPPNCYPDIRNGKTRHSLYTDVNHKTDVVTRSQFVSRDSSIITPLLPPPTPLAVQNWLKQNEDKLAVNKCRNLSDSCSLIEGPSLNNTHGFKMTPEADRNFHVDPHIQYVTAMSIEVHVRTRLGLKPDPEWDPVLVLFYSIHNDWQANNVTSGLIVIDVNQCKDLGTPVKRSKATKSPVKNSPVKASPKKLSKTKASRLVPKSPLKNFTMLHPNTISNIPVDTDRSHRYLDHCGLSPNISITYVTKESDLFEELVKLVKHHDPDFLIGYEIEMSSLGYLKDRAAHLGINLTGRLSRIPSHSPKRPVPTASGDKHVTEVQVLGRIVMNLWRIVKNEVSLMNYSFENVCFHALHKRVPKFSHQTLTDWYEQTNRLHRYRVIDYYLVRCIGNHELIEKFNLIGRTSEMARLYGIEFHNCLSRGTQYRVESMMLRLAKPANYIAASPSVYQRAKMAAPECLPLIMEPESRFYSDPVLVLDFQSLYPSMIIGYNYCYSTCLGRVRNLSQPCDYTFGTCSLSISAAELKRLKDDVTISPNGIVFLKPHVREGILPRMLSEILNTRIMVKQSMKMHKQNKTLLKMLDARQLSLKLIANVTYGYTGASYSGRMPCVEVADSIVRKGRETLERAIHLINSNPDWRARVVYGDTDSTFVLLKGRSKAEAFRIGNEMCKAITKDNPKPIKLKFEKASTFYASAGIPSLFTPDQKEGIETVRRDGCPAVGKILEKSLRLLFDSRDLSVVKRYLQRQCVKIMKGQVSQQDFTFGKEFRGSGGYRPGACVPALELSRQALSIDRRSEPRVGERVPYVVVYGSPGLPLIELVRRPEDVLTDSSLRLNAVYYITKQILPALDRGLALLGVDVFQWYRELPKINRSLSANYHTAISSHKNTIGQYFTSMHCLICHELTTDTVCKQCLKEPSYVVTVLSAKYHNALEKCHRIGQLCANCCGYSDSNYYLECTSLDCPVLYSRQTCLAQLSNEKANHSFLSRI